MRLTSCLLLLVVVPLAGCTTISGTVSKPEAPLKTGVFRAGASKMDITPPPGIPMGGHSIAGQIGRGYWSRLYARAIYFEDENGEGVVLVSCDLWSIAGGLSDRVAELVRRTPQGRHLGRSQIMIAATHTHQSPASFSSTAFYNNFAACEGGFDPEFFDFLASHIKDSIVEAIDHAEPARVYLSRTKLPSLCRNRSLPAFLLDSESTGIIQQNKDLPIGLVWPLYPDPDSYKAVDPTLTVLRVESADDPGRVISLAGFIGVHPTSMSHETQVYNSDLFGVATIETDRQLKSVHANAPTKNPPIAVLFNGAEGDVSPNWEFQDRAEALQLGAIIARGLLAPPSSKAPVEGVIQCQFKELHLAGASFKDPRYDKLQTDSLAVPGAGQVGGAEDGRTVFYDLGWKEGARARASTPTQGSKQPALDPAFLPNQSGFSLTDVVPLFTPAPNYVPVGVFRLGKVLIGAVPVEATTVMGLRLRDAMGRGTASDPPSAILLIGLANEYVSYLTTFEEYESQQYEGASTLYGPASGPLFAVTLEELASQLNTPSAPASFRYRYHPGATTKFGLDSAPADPMAGLEPLILDVNTHEPYSTTLVSSSASAKIIPDGAFARFQWQDLVPDLGNAARKSQKVLPNVSIEILDQASKWKPFVRNGFPEDDSGLDFVTVASKGASKQLSQWSSIWMMPSGATTGTFRFRVTGLVNQDYFSSPFCYNYKND